VLCRHERGGAAGGGGGGGGGWWWCVLVGMVENRERTDWCCSYQSFSISPISHNHSLTPSHHHTIKSPTSPSPSPSAPHAPASHQTPLLPIRKSPRRVPQPARCQLSFHPTSEKGPSPNIHQPNPNQTKPNQIANDETLSFFRFWWLVTIKWRTFTEYRPFMMNLSCP